MKLNIADTKALSELPPNAVTAYLRSHGWTLLRDDSEIGVFHKVIDGEDMECDVPLRQTFRDYSRRIREILVNLSLIEGRSQYDIYEDLLRTNQDVAGTSIDAPERGRSTTRSMWKARSREEVTLLDVLIDGFEKNESFTGFHCRELPMPDEDAAHRKFTAFSDEGRRWKGTPIRAQDDAGRRIVSWEDLEIRQVGRGVMVRVRPPGFSSWWHDERTWEGDPMGPMFDWLEAEQQLLPSQ